ncbi:peroxidoxin 2, putative [Eimeria tenella]|uniref:Peroxidoxin 2, putative n=1 Tax=Eimeria tenella TaxID=5802 RepID=U6L206_EIMTE|nr:peroxidoxin 2, putative [Eimeria tenella]CDJ42629.1 peroxidoxin 2, putative [Eimeria tenella]|eukprot:XP_013233379.1 peroxidoxin 2, putative [Eimeria tenella]
MPLNLGDSFPDFQAEALGAEHFRLHEYLGDSWGVMFSHPNDFTPVCTTELAEAVKLQDSFTKKNCKLVGFSCNDLQSHREWAKDIMAYAGRSGNLPFPLVCDPNRELAASLGIMDPAEKDKKGLPLTCRCVFFISPEKKLAASILYPATTGRNFAEILRLTAKFPVATPVDWTAGAKCCVVPNLAAEEAQRLLPKGHEALQLPSGKPYLRLTPDPRG